jgi:hypothetical protein
MKNIDNTFEALDESALTKIAGGMIEAVGTGNGGTTKGQIYNGPRAGQQWTPKGGGSSGGNSGSGGRR